MIIRHQGRTMTGDEIISGYAVCVADRFYIYKEDGQKIQVKRSSVVPVLTDLENDNAAQTRTVYGHPLCSLDVSEYIQANLRSKGAVCLEDLEKWTYEDFKRIRGLGPSKISKILEKLKFFGIETQVDLKDFK